MSKRKPEKNDELAQVLARVSVLMEHGGQTADEVEKETATEIPMLTEVYEGQPVTFNAVTHPEAAAIDTSRLQNEKTGPLQAEAVGPGKTVTIEDILLGMQPVIQAAVKEAVERELVHMEQTLRMKLEAELTQGLREHLQANPP